MAEHWLVTGANRGIGLELVRRLLARGDRVTASVRDAKARDVLRDALPAPVETLMFDSRDETAIRAAAASLRDPIDALIANAGAYGPQRQASLDMDFDGALDLLSVNALGPLRVAQAFLPLLLKSRAPRLALMSSVLGSLALAGSYDMAYRASKAALNKFAQGLAQDLKSDGVCVVALHPGWVRTDMGGPNADISVEESGEGLLRVLDALTMKDTGRFLDYRGADVAW